MQDEKFNEIEENIKHLEKELNRLKKEFKMESKPKNLTSELDEKILADKIAKHLKYLKDNGGR